MDLAYIHDGYTRNGHIKAVPGLHPEVKFTFRPATAAQVELILGKTRREQNDDAVTSFHSQVIASHVIEWDIQDEKKRPLEIKVDKIRRLQSGVFGKLFGMVIGQIPSEETPQEGQPDSSLDYVALVNGITTEEAEAKN